MSAMLEFYFRFDFVLFIIISMSVCIGVPNFIQIQQVRTAELCMTSTLSRYRTDVLALKRH